METLRNIWFDYVGIMISYLIEIITAIIGILTLSFYRPHWDIDFQNWLIKKQYKSRLE